MRIQREEKPGQARAGHGSNGRPADANKKEESSPMIHLSAHLSPKTQSAAPSRKTNPGKRAAARTATLAFSLLFLLIGACTTGGSAAGKNFIHDYTARAENGQFRVVVEIPAGTSEKWEIDKETGKLFLEHVDNKPRIIKYIPYPFNYGSIPGTLLSKEDGGDGDPLDAVVIGESVPRGSVLSVKVIGYLKMIDKGEQDDKVIAVAPGSPLYRINDISALNEEYPGITRIISTWFENYKGKKKVITVSGFADSAEARRLIERSLIK